MRTKARTANKGVKYPCDMCSFSAPSDEVLRTHLEKNHQFTRMERRRTGYSQEERKRNGVCVFFNRGNCTFEDFCRFAHEEKPQCHFDGHCRNSNCRFLHTKQNQSTPVGSSKTPVGSSKSPFLYRRGLQNNPLQRHHGGAQRGQGLRR